MIGDGVGGILGFDVFCYSVNVGIGSWGSSCCGSMNNELFFLEVGLVWDFLVDGVEGLGWVSLEFLVLFV